ncbi:MAG: SIS domain-containing protein [Candidatus Thermoplasmatota archaeon]|jgi:glucose/mannose-6-phosphate isomerase
MPASRNPDFLKKIQSKAQLLLEGHQAGMARGEPGLRAGGLLFAGMGGSGAASLLVRDAASRVLELPFTIAQSHGVPHHVRKDWRVLAVSYSGETEETLEAVREASSRGCKVTAFTTGGTLENLADECVVQPSGYQPRLALAHAWFSLLGFLEGSGLLAQPVPVASAVAAVREVDAACGPHVPESRNEAKQLARRLHERIPQIYTTPAFTGIGTFFASLLNENAKKIADIDEIPECNHNAFTGWSGDANRAHFTVLVLSDRGQRPEMTQRIAFMENRYTAWGVPWDHRQFAATDTFASHVVEQARALQLLDYTSYYTAVLRGVDPAEIDVVVGLKAHLRQGAPAPAASPVQTPPETVPAPVQTLRKPGRPRHVRIAARA